MNRYPVPVDEHRGRRDSRYESERRPLPQWKVTLRRWVPFVDPSTYACAAAVLAAEWAGPTLAARLLEQLADSLVGAL